MMKKFLSIVLMVALFCTGFLVAGIAVDDNTYVSISDECLVESKLLENDIVFTYKQVSGDCDGLLLGIPADAVLGDNCFKAKGNYRIEYCDENGNLLRNSSAHIGTSDIIKVYDSNDNLVKKYKLVTYGDPNGDGYFDVLDTYVSALCHNGFVSFEEAPAVYESVKLGLDQNSDDVDVYDYQTMVNGVVSDTLNDNDKGRKKYLNDTLSFESVIYDCDGQEKPAQVVAESEDFKELIRINYNGNDTVPSAPGVYAVTAVIPESDEYLVTPGIKKMGFIVIAPDDGSGDDFVTTVDNSNRVITIDIKKPNATGAGLSSGINNWVNSAYYTTVSSKNVTSSSELFDSLSLRSYEYYKTENSVVSKTQKTINNLTDTSTHALGCYLPDDYTLWNNNNAEKVLPVSVSDEKNNFSYSIVFRQDDETVKELEHTLNIWKSSTSRSQRSICPTQSTGVDKKVVFFTKNYREAFIKAERRILRETGKYENVVKTCIGAGENHPSMKDALSGTGLKTVLLGNDDTISFVTASSKAGLPQISSSAQLLYNDDFVRYSSFTGDDLKDLTKLSEFSKLVKKVLSGFDMDVELTTTTDTILKKDSKGWCRYACVDDASGIRYTSDCFLEFKYVDATADAHRTITVTPVSGCTIETKIAPDGCLTAAQKKNQEANTDKLAQNEPFRINAVLADGYKPSVKDADGNDVYYDSECGWYIMPASNVTVTAVPIN